MSEKSFSSIVLIIIFMMMGFSEDSSAKLVKGHMRKGKYITPYVTTGYGKSYLKNNHVHLRRQRMPHRGTNLQSLRE